jgi:hypothetical protein
MSSLRSRVLAASLSLAAVLAVSAPALAADPAPKITAVKPSPVPGLKGKQNFVVVGSNFRPGATLTLIDLTRDRKFADLAPASVMATQIERQVNFGEVDSEWQVKVRNHDGTESETFDFNVSGKTLASAAKPATVPAPAAKPAAPPPVAAAPATKPTVEIPKPVTETPKPAAETPKPVVAPPAVAAAPAPAVAPPRAPAASAPQRSVNAKPRLVAKIEQVQPPSWVERRGVRASIKPGWAVLAGDRLITGPEGRAQLTLPGNAKLKVGSDTSIEFSETNALAIQPAGTDRKLLRVTRGVVDFTAPAVQRAALGPLVVSLGYSTDARVMNGQIWARVASNEIVVALLDGVTDLRGPGFSQRLDKRETFITVPASGGTPRPAIDVAKEKLAWWLAQVEEVHGKAILVAGGGWDVGLRTGYDLADLQDVARMLQQKGFPSEVTPVREPGRKLWYRLAVRRFASENDARGFAQTARGLGFKDAWVMPPA